MHRARCVTTLGLAGMLAGAITSTSLAAPVLTNTAAVKAAVGDEVTQVRWGWGWGAGALIGGLALGTALATPSYGYYGSPYGYGSPYAYNYPYTYSYGYSGYSGYPYYRRAYWGYPGYGGARRAYWGGYGYRRW